MLKLPGTGEALYQELVASLLDDEPATDGTRRAPYSCIAAFKGDAPVYNQVIGTANQALAEHPNHPLHGWTIRYDKVQMYFIAAPPT